RAPERDRARARRLALRPVPAPTEPGNSGGCRWPWRFRPPVRAPAQVPVGISRETMGARLGNSERIGELAPCDRHERPVLILRESHSRVDDPRRLAVEEAARFVE